MDLWYLVIGLAGGAAADGMAGVDDLVPPGACMDVPIPSDILLNG